MSRILVSPEQLQQVATHFKRASEQSVIINTKLKQRINHLESQWQGATQKGFYMHFRQSQRVMENFTLSLTHISNELERIATRFREADLEINTPNHDNRTMIIPEKGPNKAFPEKIEGIGWTYPHAGWRRRERSTSNASHWRRRWKRKLGGSIRMPEAEHYNRESMTMKDDEKDPGPKATTLAIGEEGDQNRPIIRTLAVPEEGAEQVVGTLPGKKVIPPWDGPIRMPNKKAKGARGTRWLFKRKMKRNSGRSHSYVRGRAL